MFWSIRGRVHCPAWWSRVTQAFAIALIVASCAPGSDLPPLPEGPPGPYQLSADDTVRITTFGESALSGQFLVDDRGAIDIPLLGTIPVSGETPAELGQQIEELVRRKNLLLDPKVAVEVVGYRPVFILGEVAKPGQYPYRPGMTVLTAVALAGGFTYRAQTGYAAILRTENGHSIEGRVSRGAEVRPGDVITIEERYF